MANKEAERKESLRKSRELQRTIHVQKQSQVRFVPLFDVLCCNSPAAVRDVYTTPH